MVEKRHEEVHNSLKDNHNIKENIFFNIKSNVLSDSLNMKQHYLAKLSS